MNEAQDAEGSLKTWPKTLLSHMHHSTIHWDITKDKTKAQNEELTLPEWMLWRQSLYSPAAWRRQTPLVSLCQQRRHETPAGEPQTLPFRTARWARTLTPPPPRWPRSLLATLVPDKMPLSPGCPITCRWIPPRQPQLVWALEIVQKVD